jgi:hypothetical protein
METIMTYRGYVKNGQVLLDGPVRLPEGAEVNITVVEHQPPKPTIWDKLRALAGTVEGPEDWARNHDHYIHGTPRRP